MTRVLVCGGRDFTHAETVNRVLDAAHAAYGITLIIEGGARGADRLASAWARSRNVPIRRFPAQWDRDGTAAGAIRNSKMLKDGQPEKAFAFPGGRGTDDMVRKLRKAGVPVVRIYDTVGE